MESCSGGNTLIQCDDIMPDPEILNLFLAHLQNLPSME